MKVRRGDSIVEWKIFCPSLLNDVFGAEWHVFPNYINDAICHVQSGTREVLTHLGYVEFAVTVLSATRRRLYQFTLPTTDPSDVHQPSDTGKEVDGTRGRGLPSQRILLIWAFCPGGTT